MNTETQNTLPEIDAQTIVSVAVSESEAAAQEAVAEVVAEIQQEVETQNELELLRGQINSQGKLLSDVNDKLNIIIGKMDVVEHETVVTHDIVNEVSNTVSEIVLETPAEIAETIEQINNDEEVEAGVVAEVLDTNDVIDAIIPEQKKERRRVRYL